MSVDLRSSSLFSRSSLVLLDDCLVKLERGQTEDRVRKYMFDAIEAVIIWKSVPWVYLSIIIIFLGGPAFCLLVLVHASVANWIGGGLLVAAVPLVAWYLYCRQTTIRIVRFGQSDDIKGIFRPGRLRRVLDRLITGIRALQQREIDQLARHEQQPPQANTTAQESTGLPE
jgi:hypothetical protein